MGELHKKIGEVGEKLVYAFFEQIGWAPMSPGIDLECRFPGKHERRQENGTHGIDLMFSYVCPMVPAFRRNVLISIKSSNSEQTKTDTRSIKEALTDVATALTCFEHSSQLATFVGQGGATAHENIGLLVKIDKDPEGEKSFLGELGPRTQIELEGTSAVCFVENARFDFVDKVMQHAEKRFKDHQLSFLIPSSPLNPSAESKKNSSPILPLQSLVAGPIALRVEEEEAETASGELAIYSQDDFSIPGFKRLLSIAHNLSRSWVKATIVFPDYQDIRDGDLARTVLAAMADKRFAKKIRLESLDLRLRMT